MAQSLVLLGYQYDFHEPEIVALTGAVPLCIGVVNKLKVESDFTVRT